MAYCLDTNILLRLAEPGTADSETAQRAIKYLRMAGHEVFITPQNLVEFWTVATRPTSVNGLGLSTANAATEVKSIEALFPLLPDNERIHAEWRKIVQEFNVTGVRAHDARIAAYLRVHGIDNILTFNVADFQALGNPTPVHPRDVLAPS